MHCEAAHPQHKPIFIAQGLAPAVTLVAGVLVGLEQLSVELLTTVVLIGGGMAGALGEHSWSPSYSALGLALFSTSLVCDATRLVLI